MNKNKQFDLGLHVLPIRHITSQMYLFKCLDKYGKEWQCQVLKYNQTSLSRTRLFQITAYLEVKI